MKKLILLIIFQSFSFLIFPQQELSPKTIFKNSLATYKNMEYGQIRVAIKHKEFQSLDTIEYVYLFSFNEKKHSQPNNFRIQYSNRNIDILVNKHIEYIINDNECIKYSIKTTKPVQYNNFARCRQLPPYDVNTIFASFLFDLYSPTARLVNENNAYKIYFKNSIKDVYYEFDSNYYLSKFRYIRDTSIVSPGVIFESWEFDHLVTEEDSLDRILSIKNFKTDCNTDLEFEEKIYVDSENYDSCLHFLNQITGNDNLVNEYDYIFTEFWFLACEPCIKSIKYLNEVFPDDSSIVFFPINVYDTDSISISNYFTANSIKFKSYYLSEKNNALPLGISSCPTYLLIDNRIKEIQMLTGYSDKNKKEIKRFIKKAKQI